MRHSSKEPTERETPSTQLLNELIDLLLKLNAKLREKITPRRKKEETGAENTEMLVIILSQSPGTPPSSPKMPRSEKPRAPKDGWIDKLFDEIEREFGGRKKS